MPEPLDENRDEISVATRTDQANVSAVRKATTKNRWEKEEPIVPDRKNKRLSARGRENSFRIFDPKTQGLGQESKDSQRECDQRSRPPTIQLHSGARALSSFQR